MHGEPDREFCAGLPGRQVEAGSSVGALAFLVGFCIACDMTLGSIVVGENCSIVGNQHRDLSVRK